SLYCGVGEASTSSGRVQSSGRINIRSTSKVGSVCCADRIARATYGVKWIGGTCWLGSSMLTGMAFDPDDKRPLFERVVDDLRNDIKNGKLKPEERVP